MGRQQPTRAAARAAEAAGKHNDTFQQALDCMDAEHQQALAALHRRYQQADYREQYQYHKQPTTSVILQPKLSAYAQILGNLNHICPSTNPVIEAQVLCICKGVMI